MKKIKNAVKALFNACRNTLRRISGGHAEELNAYSVEINAALMQIRLSAPLITPTARRLGGAIVPIRDNARQSGLVYLIESDGSVSELEERFGDMPKTLSRLSRAMERMSSSVEKTVGVCVKRDFPGLLKKNISVLEPRFAEERSAVRKLYERSARFLLRDLEYSVGKADSERLEGFASTFARVFGTKEVKKTLRENAGASPLYTEIRKSGEASRNIGEQLATLREIVVTQKKQIEHIVRTRGEDTRLSEENMEAIVDEIGRRIQRQRRSGALRNGVV